MYGYFGTMRTQPDQHDEVIAILLESAASLREHGCHSYVVGVAEGDPDLICVSELWDSREAHDASLQLPAVREAITRAMPLLTGEFAGQEMTVRGGLGVPDA
ncbi:MAG: putative quinol monooxygenase [Dehalococcoidia bacterium]